MKNSKFRKAALLRKVTASFLTILTFLGLLGILFYQSDLNLFSEMIELISDIFSTEKEEVPSVNYP